MRVARGPTGPASTNINLIKTKVIWEKPANHYPLPLVYLNNWVLNAVFVASVLLKEVYLLLIGVLVANEKN